VRAFVAATVQRVQARQAIGRVTRLMIAAPEGRKVIAGGVSRRNAWRTTSPQPRKGGTGFRSAPAGLGTNFLLSLFPALTGGATSCRPSGPGSIRTDVLLSGPPEAQCVASSTRRISSSVRP
jgi:hypothetical protein